MSDRIKVLLIDQDPVFRIGLRVVVEQFPDLQVAAEAETIAAALEILAQSSQANLSTDLVVLELGLKKQTRGEGSLFASVSLNQAKSDSVELQLCQTLKSQYPNLPVLLLSTLQDPTQLAAVKAIGIDGYCPKGIPVSELVAAMRQVAAGRSYWTKTTGNNTNAKLPTAPLSSKASPPDLVRPFATLRNHLRLSGLRQIDVSLAEVRTQLQVPGLPLLAQAIVAGQRRELLAARWLINQLFPPFTQPRPVYPSQTPSEPLLSSNLSATQDNYGENTVALPLADPETSSHLITSLQADLFNSTLAKLQFSLQNVTGVPLEIDIWREDKKRELLHLILQKIEDVLNELRFSQVQASQLPEMQSVIMRDLWQAATIDFFGRYSTLQVGDASGKGQALRNLEIVNLLLQDTLVVQTAILDKIPLVVELLSHLLFQTPLVIDNVAYAPGSPEAMDRAGSVLQNLLIQLANGVVQPLLNKLADVEEIKQRFYDRRLISTREIERFRNNLSWKYRLNNYISEPKAIFESRYELFVLASRGIAKISIYAARGQELTQLSGIQQAVTLVLEIRDAIAPPLQAAVAFLGSGIVYVLTQVVGRAIGLIGRGILQGISGASKLKIKD